MEMKDTLKKLSALHEKSSAAPWFCVTTDDSRHMGATYVGTSNRGHGHDNEKGLDGSREHEIVALTYHQSGPAVQPDESDRASANSELIATMRTELANILDHIERLESANRALRHEQQRLRRAPEKDWHAMTQAMSPIFAKLVELGHQDLARAGISALDQGHTYVNRLLNDQTEKSAS
jgi:hypothetical protein